MKYEGMLLFLQYIRTTRYSGRAREHGSVNTKLPAADLERSKDRVSIQSKSNFFAPLLYVLANKRDPTSSKQLTHRIDYMLIDREVLSPPRKASRIEGNLRKDFKAL